MINRFINEMTLIEDQNIRRFVWKCLENAPSYFWTISSSSTGKYHPKDEFKEGGMVLHTKRSVKVAYHLCESLSVYGINKDCIIAAMIMHDLCCRGFPEDTGHTVDGHGYLWIVMARTCWTKQDFIDNRHFMLISRLILNHMGKYDLPFSSEWNNKLDTICQLADYLSSREDVIVQINKDINEK